MTDESDCLCSSTCHAHCMRQHHAANSSPRGGKVQEMTSAMTSPMEMLVDCELDAGEHAECCPGMLTNSVDQCAGADQECW